MKVAFGRLLVLTLLFGVIEAGIDVGNAAAPNEHPGSHEVHSHPGSDSGPSDSDGTEMEHYCHCGTHAAALPFSVGTPPFHNSDVGSDVAIDVYPSVTFPPPVPPPNA